MILPPETAAVDCTITPELALLRLVRLYVNPGQDALSRPQAAIVCVYWTNKQRGCKTGSVISQP